MKHKKIALTALGTLTTFAIPLATVVACGAETAEHKSETETHENKKHQKSAEELRKENELKLNKQKETEIIKEFKGLGQKWNSYDANSNYNFHADVMNDFKIDPMKKSKVFTLNDINYIDQKYAIADIINQKIFDAYQELVKKADIKVQNYSLNKDANNQALTISFDIILTPKFLEDKTPQTINISKKINGFAQDNTSKQNAIDETTLQKYASKIEYNPYQWDSQTKTEVFEGLVANSQGIENTDDDWHEKIINSYNKDGDGRGNSQYDYFLSDGKNNNPDTQVAFDKKEITNNNLKPFIDNFNFVFFRDKKGNRTNTTLNFDVFDELLKDKRFKIESFQLLKSAYFDDARGKTMGPSMANWAEILFRTLIIKNKKDVLVLKNENLYSGLIFKFHVKLGNIGKDLLVAVPILS